MRISSTHPLQIAEVRFAEGCGKLGFTFSPGETRANEPSPASRPDRRLDHALVESWNAAALVRLVEPAERDEPGVPGLGNAVSDGSLVCHYLPIRDDGMPDPMFHDVWQESGEELRAVLRAGFNVLLHCKTSPSRAGMVAAQLLIELGMDAREAAAAVRALNPGAIETPAERDYLMTLGTLPENVPPRSREAMADRALGAMLGLAIGDAWRATDEFVESDLDDPTDGGQLSRQPGQWSNATAMALALMESLLVHADLDEADLMTRFGDWHEHGSYSCTGRWFDVGTVLRTALERWKRFGDPFAGSTNPRSAGSGSCARLAPVVIRHWNDRRKLRDVAARQSQTTHAAPEAVDACIALAEVMVDAFAGLPRSEVLRPRLGHYAGAVATVMAGSWRGKHRRDLTISGYVTHSLEAALWCVGRTGSFFDAVALAADLGGDDDTGTNANTNTIAAITGQLAGAIYGASGIPVSSKERLAWGERITDTAQQLFAASWPV